LPASLFARHQSWMAATVSASGAQRKIGRPKVDSVTKVWQRSGSKVGQVGSGASL